MVGVLAINIFLRAKVVVLRSANVHGSPSPSTSLGKASTSSRKIYLQGVERSPTAELAPVRSIMPPTNSLENKVLPESLDLEAAILSLNLGVSSIIVESLCLESLFAISTVG